MTTHAVHHDPAENVGRRERLGVRLLIVADGAFVLGTIFTFLYLRSLNVNDGWLPEGVERVGSSSIWVVTLPLIIAALLHRYGEGHRGAFRATSALTFLVLAAGLVLQLQQVMQTSFFSVEEETMHFEGTYASSWLLLALANVLHYGIGAFVALGLAIRAQRAHVDPELEVWRLRTAGSWFTWIAFAGLASAITLLS